MAIYKGQWIDDETGNVFYPHTSTDVVVNSAGKNVDALLNEKSNSNHAHDDRYYTKTEMNSKLNAKLDITGNASNVTNTFTQAATRANLTTGEKLSASLGKIMKWFSDLKAVAFSGSYNDLTNKPTSLKNPTSMKVQLNGGTTEGTNQYTYDGSAAKNINITPSSIGAAASSHTHTASQITGLTASRALVSDSSGKPTVSAVTATELGYLDGVTSGIQTQLNAKSKITDANGNVLSSVPMTAPQSLTINGDFQINQRGKSEYIENGYTLDMWSCILTNGNKLSQLPSGYGVLINKTKANQTVLRQRNPNVSKYPVGTKFTVVYDFESNVLFSNEVGFGKQRKSIQVEAKRKQYSFTWTLQSTDIDENKNVDILVFNNTDTNVQLKVHSVCLFEGEIAYKHQKEDKTLALTRCLPFCERAKFTVTATGAYFMNGFSYKMAKENNPIINILSVANSDGAVNKADFSFSVIDKYFANFIRYKGGSCESLKNYVYTFDVLMSCESL